MSNIPEPQPMHKWGFIEELQRYVPPVFFYEKRGARHDELDLSIGIEYRGIANSQELLTTAENDLERFFRKAGIYKPGGIPICTKLVKSNELINDSYLISVADESIELSAGNIEGIRRAIYYLEDLLLLSPGPFLKKGIIKRIAWLKNRISRCFFGPIKRPPYNHDELLDDIDYYPDEYLNRLAHEGVNGLWLTVSLRDLCKTSITELHSDATQRLKKLRNTVNKCRKYGIKIWLFMIEPKSFALNDPFLKKHPEFKGALSEDNDSYCFCPSSEKAQKYLYESTNWLFEQVSGLGGIINISHGERVTTCLSSVCSIFDNPVECPRCGAIPKGEILKQSLGAMHKGMTDANPEAELISWFYMPTPLEKAKWVFEVAEYLPKDIILQYNFESNGMKNQLGQPRIGGDYWLSYVGPSDDFVRLSEKAMAAGIQVSAKIQVGCSHEVATVPFVPVPGLLYRKYKKMYKNGCSSVMQCWYFGNYPGLMNKTAGVLAFENFNQTEKEFLTEIARTEWGQFANQVVTAWKKFAAGYSNYPLSNQFQYYGPIHDGVVWPLLLKPELEPLQPTWKPKLPPSGDAIGECLKGFTLSEALSLCTTMDKEWEKGVLLLKELVPHFQNNEERLKDIALAEALGIQIKSGKNILRFYYLRCQFYASVCSDALKILQEMQCIVQKEIQNSRRMIELCESDSRLGFHPEAENYKYYPAKLKWRIKQLRELLETDFKKAWKDLTGGKMLSLPPVSKTIYNCGSGWISCKNFSWKIDKAEDGFTIHVECNFLSSILIVSLIDQTGTVFPWSFRCNLDNSIPNFSWGEIKTEKISSNKWKLKITVPALSWNMDKSLKPAYFSFIYLNPTTTEKRKVEFWPFSENEIKKRLTFGYYTPDNTAFLKT